MAHRRVSTSTFLSMKRALLVLPVLVTLVLFLQRTQPDLPTKRPPSHEADRINPAIGEATQTQPVLARPPEAPAEGSAASGQLEPGLQKNTPAQASRTDTFAFLPEEASERPQPTADSLEISQRVDAMLRHAHREDRVLLSYNSAASRRDAVKLNDTIAAQLLRHYPTLGNGRMVALELTRHSAVRDSLIHLLASGLVEYAEPDYIYFPTSDTTEAAGMSTEEPVDDPEADAPSSWSVASSEDTLIDAAPNDYSPSSLYAMAKVGAPAAWDLLPTPQDSDPAVLVAVIDTGVRYTHADLAANMWVNPGETAGNGIDDDGNGYVDDVYGINAITGSGNPADDHGHGTHCAGTIGAVGNNNTGVVGIAWKVKVKLMALKFMGASNGGATSDAIECIAYAAAHGAKILSNSWGGTGSSTSLSNAITSVRAQGCLFIAAAGNNSVNCDVTPHYPAAYTQDNIISVASSDSADRRSSFSNYGKRTVDLFAPGSSIYSTGFANDSAYTTMSGTSMATPLVAGACAVLKAAQPDEDYAQLRERLLSTVDAPSGLLNLVSTGGRMNLSRAASTDLEITADDAVWHNATTGQLCLWKLNGSTLDSYAIHSLRITGWQLKACGDLDGDGDDDLVWFRPSDGSICQWFLDGTTLRSSRTLAARAAGWGLVGVADFDGNGTPDYVFQHPTSRLVYVWYMSDATRTSAVQLSATVSGWNIVAARDDNGDHNIELYWHRPSTGQFCRWIMNGTALGSSQNLPSAPTAWRPVEARDRNADGSVDFTWYNATTGQACVWMMNNLAISSSPVWSTTARGWSYCPRID